MLECSRNKPGTPKERLKKFLFYVNFKVNPEVTRNDFTRNEQIDLNMLVKTCDLPKYNMNVEEKIQYNKIKFASVFGELAFDEY